MPELSPYLLLSKRQRIKQSLRYVRAKLGRFNRPSFMIIGAQKSGTTSVHSTLLKHPNLVGAHFKELHYFSNDSWYSKRDIADYHSFFPAQSRSEANYFESTPLYLYHPKVAERLCEYDPKLKLIVLLRDPAERAFSAWKMHHFRFDGSKLAFLHDPRDFDAAIKEELNGNLEDFSVDRDFFAYVKRGLYQSQLERYFTVFPRDQLLVLGSCQLQSQPSKTLNRVMSFLEVSQLELPPQTVNVGNGQEIEHDGLLQKLRDFFRPHNESLFEMLGESFDW